MIGDVIKKEPATLLIKGCPFCGGTAKCVEARSHAMIYCVDCRAEMDAPNKEEVVKKWNERVWDAEDVDYLI